MNTNPSLNAYSTRLKQEYGRTRPTSQRSMRNRSTPESLPSERPPRLISFLARVIARIFYFRNQSNNSSLTSSQNHKFNRPAPAPRADRHRSNGSNSGSGSGSKVGREHKPLNRLASLLLRTPFEYSIFFTAVKHTVKCNQEVNFKCK